MLAEVDIKGPVKSDTQYTASDVYDLPVRLYK